MNKRAMSMACDYAFDPESDELSEILAFHGDERLGRLFSETANFINRQSMYHGDFYGENSFRGYYGLVVMRGELCVATALSHKSTGNTLYLSRLACDESIRGQGIGSELLRCTEGIAQANGFTAVSTRPRSEASAEYFRKQGYEEGSNGFYYVQI